jgi:hypothetical protein
MGIAEAVHWHQADLLDGLQQETKPPQVDVDLYLSNWGEIKDPYYAVFGRVQGRALAELWKTHPHIAHLNLRDYKQRSDVNAAIAMTAQEESQHFWYFNNGLTIICDSIRPGVFGRMQPDLAVFHFEGISLVNGAQTTGIVGDHFDLIPDEDKDKLWIQIRAIAVKNCPDGFAKRVTKFTNLQNAITTQDFVSLDPVHSRIATDFAVEKRKYAFRWGGEMDPTGEHGCTLKEATMSLACANGDSWYAVQAKREISVLWDTDSPRYKALFPADVPASKIWNAVQILRTALAAVNSHETDNAPKSEQVSRNLQWIVLHLVFQDPEIEGWDSAADIHALLPQVEKVAHRMYGAVRSDIDRNHPNEYLASLSKHFDKCSALAGRIRFPAEVPTGPGTGLLF